MATFTAAILANPPGTLTTSGVQTITPWAVFTWGQARLGVARGAQVKIWNGTAWVAAPSS
jgi:hypothetical protein